MPRKVDTYTFQGEVWSLRPAAEPYAITLPQERTQERGEGATESAAPLFITLNGHAWHARSPRNFHAERLDWPPRSWSRRKRDPAPERRFRIGRSSITARLDRSLPVTARRIRAASGSRSAARMRIRLALVLILSFLRSPTARAIFEAHGFTFLLK